MKLQDRVKLKKFINELKKIRGRHTELVSVFVPKDYDLNKINQHLAEEQSTAQNIKDARTRNNVIDSLERCIRHLRLYKKTPENGLALFAGNASENESKIDIKVWSLEPPEPLNFRLYRCDQTFLLDPLIEMLETKEIFGLIVLDRREGDVGTLKGTRIESIVHMTSGVPGKTKAGGQCVVPDTVITLYDNSKILLKDVKEGDLVKSYNFKTKKFQSSKVLKKWDVKKDKTIIIKSGNKTLKCSEDHLVFIGNPKTKYAGELKTKDSLLHNDLKILKIDSLKTHIKSVNMIDIEVEDQNFIANGIIVHNSAARFERLREGAAKEFYRRIGEAANKAFLEMKDLKGILVGGPGPTKEEFLEGGHLNEQLKRKVVAIEDLGYTGDFGLQELVDKSQEALVNLEITEEKSILNEFFTLLGKNENMVSYGDKVDYALEMGAVDKLLLSENLDEKEIERYEEKALNYGTKIVIISINTREGEQLKTIGGKAALLRYPI